jgi:hypothetical protein
MLQGVTMLQVEATPIIGFEKSSRLNPTGYSIARLGARSGPSNKMLECCRTEPCSGFFDLVVLWALDERVFIIPEILTTKANPDKPDCRPSHSSGALQFPNAAYPPTSNMRSLGFSLPKIIKQLDRPIRQSNQFAFLNPKSPIH